MRYLLAEVKEELLEDEDGPGAAEDDEGLPREEAEQGTSHGSAQEALHYSLLHEKAKRLREAEGAVGPQFPLRLKPAILEGSSLEDRIFAGK